MRLNVFILCSRSYNNIQLLKFLYLIDLPIIVSGNRLACFEPQEVMWKGESGQAFNLPSLISQSSDFVAPLNGLASFDSNTVRHSGYSHTIFRLPLRTQVSGLSSSVYNTQKLLELLEALKEEAKYLLLFLKSVCKIEVAHISPFGQHSSFFCVEIAPASLASVLAKRDCFMQQLRQAHAKQPYHITDVISFTASFAVVVTDSRKNQVYTTNCLVANHVGSADPYVQAAAAKQLTFPWVGVALELGGNSAGGRIFCFLPMPIETSSGLPIHVNGTFGLNDERRTLKWPGIERRNDPTANWNKILVRQLLPPCYAMLLIEARNHLSPSQFYNAWPDVEIVKNTQFSEILQPLFTALFRQAVVWTKRTEALQIVDNWVLISQVTFTSEGISLPSVINKVLSSCGVQLATIPAVIWRAIQLIRVSVTVVSPQLVRFSLRSYPGSYYNIDQYGKRELLTYCLSDNCYSDLSGLNLLPLANGTFTTFDNYYRMQMVYLCSANCPRSLLPSLDHLLVDMSDDPSLQMSLDQVAASLQTRLRVLTEKEVASLLTQVMSSIANWRSSSLTSMPHSQLTFSWLQTFWEWLGSRDLSLFSNQLLVPCYISISNSTSSFYLTRLNIGEPVVYISKHTSYSNCLLSAFYKMSVRICLQSEFSFVQHMQLSRYVKYLNTNNLLDAVYSQSNYQSIVFSTDEANSLRTFLASSSYSSSETRAAVLQNLTIFTSASNSHGQLYSIRSAAAQSVSRQALGEPSNSAIDLSYLPSNLVLFSRGDYHQLQLLQALKISFSTDYRLLVNYVFPLIRNRTFPEYLIDNLMTEMLDMFTVLNFRERGSNLSGSLQGLPFVKTLHGRKCPSELFNPLSEDIAALYDGEDVFPQAPYNTFQRIHVLLSCGLHTSVTPQQVLNIVYFISSSASSYPQQVNSTKLNRAKAVLKYISTPSFFRQTVGYYTVPVLMGSYPFSSAFKHLTTTRSWLPVLSDRPSGYCDKLPWKGSSYNSHFVSLSSSVALLSSSKADTLPHLVGSQMYLVSPTVSSQTVAILSTDSADITQHVVAHFREILARKDQLSVKEMDSLVHQVYRYMNSEGSSGLEQLYAIKEWIYLKREDRLMASSEVPMKQNPTFRQDLEPYIYILPDRLSQYTTIFGPNSGIKPTVSQDQILAILATIREEVATGTQQTTAQETWDMVMSILNWLTNNGNKSVSVDPYVPVETESDWPKLVTASEVVYTDNDFMKDYLQSSDERDQYVFVHDNINPRLAQALGVVPLTEFLNISEDTFEDAGQHEPLTTRLKNILRDYKDGLTIIKELLQNADDAEATELNICYDARQHVQDKKKLFFSGMAEAHGPALIVHNNSTFSDDDLKNITMLAAGTKRGKALKIGKFGVGFCSVYHMTDVPSFISRDYFYIFDPTLSYLQKEVKSSAKPGKKLKFANKFISHSKQLEPYNGLFGFNKIKSYQGTMFRLPFRTHISELSGTCYTEDSIKELIEAIRESSAKLLLFLRHVKTITFQRIDPGETTPVVVLKVTQETVPLPLSLSGVEVQQISITGQDTAQIKCCDWLVSRKNEKISQNEYCTASVACPLGSSDCYKVDQNFEGEVFCFLPLSQKTGLPVHVSSNFAVINNRRGIWTSDEATSQTEKEVTWNITLMEGVIAKAYHALLAGLKSMSNDNLVSDYTFYRLWPQEEKLLRQNPWVNMLEQLYQLISSDQLCYSANHKEWLSLDTSRFLTPGILCQGSEQLTIPSCVLNVLQYLDMPIVDLPITYHKCFNLKNVTIDESGFAEIFFENLSKLESILSTRSEVIQHMLEVYATEYDDMTYRRYKLEEYFKKYSSIPCMPDGKTLQKCTEVVDPKAEFASLFDSSEGCFPLKQLSKRHLCYTALGDLGMISEILPIDLLEERAMTIPTLYKSDRTKALRRIKLILATLNKYKTGEVKRSKLLSIPFLPVLPRPLGYFSPWKGDKFELMCSKDLMVVGSHRYHKYRNSFITGSQVAFVNEKTIEDGGCDFIKDNILSLLEVRKSPSIKEVVAHLAQVQKEFQSHQPPSEELILHTNKVCDNVYDYLDNELKPSKTLPASPEQEPVYIDLESQYGVSHVWTGKQFVETEKVAKEWNIDGPYLYPWHSSISSRSHLIESLQLKQQFTFKDAQRAIEEMQKDFGDKPVNKNCQKMLKDVVALLQKCDLTSILSEHLELMLPDENYVLHHSKTLCYVDVDLPQKDPSNKYVNEIVPPKLAKQLGVRALRSKMLEKYSTHYSTIKFGQHEALTTRIQSILHDYPLDITLLKELLQNAEDAKATKMHVILDCRTHGTKRVFSENWEKLQGPALLVWSDSVFSDNDLLGIQQLGVGSKKNDFNTIGQFGIGFNAVYHVTDCPSFITGGETLCVLDPHCKYVNEADERYPGQRFNISSPEFWEQFYDVGSAFLRSGLNKCPPELNNGTLFRLPLRFTLDHMKSSEIVKKDKDGNPLGPPITVPAMIDFLNEWAPQLKKSMLFLTSVKELQFLIIDDNSNTMQAIHKYCAVVDDLTLKRREEFQKSLTAFRSESGNDSLVIRYPLTLSSTPPGKEETVDEKWLIQQGVGDIENEQQKWSLIDSLKPRHGIAALLHSSHFSEEDSPGQVFCFLPLPIRSNLPVHINGSFILHANRRSLWRSDVKDVNASWNDMIFQALASSYANFLDHAREYYMSQSHYSTLSDAKEAISNYYRIFPSTIDVDQHYQLLVQNVFSKLVEHNCNILAVVNCKEDSSCTDLSNNGADEDSKRVRVIWHPPKGDYPLTQVYFAEFSDEWEDLRTIVEDIGMKLTEANNSLYYHLNLAISEPEDKLKKTNQKSVFDFYVSCSIVSQLQFPCAIENTAFKTVTNFKRFTQYLLIEEPFTEEVHFPEDPFDHPLLLAADNTIQRFKEDAKIIKSYYSHLFPKAHECFLHPDLVGIKYLNTYFLCSSPQSDSTSEYSLEIVSGIFSKQLPYSLKDNRLEQLPNGFTQDNLIALWKCLSTDPIFSQHKSTLLKEWALLPDSSGTVYSYGDHLEPIIPAEFDQETDESAHQMYKLLQKIGMPFLDTRIVGHDYHSLTCPNIRERASVLKALYHKFNEEKEQMLKIHKENVEIAVSYLRQISFRFNPENQKHIRGLPLFECIDGELRALHSTKTFLWPANTPTAGFSDWNDPSVTLFVQKCSSWKELDSPESLSIFRISEEELYCSYIFKCFSYFTQEERFKHLVHIRDNLFPLVKMNINKTDLLWDEANDFWRKLKDLPCINEVDMEDTNEKESLRPVREYFDGNTTILKTFNKNLRSLPKDFTGSESWEKWLEFFKMLGLKHTVSKKEFLQYCEETSVGSIPDHINVETASSVLLEHLFSESARDEGWHSDESFLADVCDVPFITVTPVPNELTAIHGAIGEKELVKLKEAANINCLVFLWTVMPIVKLPEKWQSYPELLEQLGIIYEARLPVHDVMRNLINICIHNTGKMLSKSTGGKMIMQVIASNFKLLQQNLPTEENLELLKDIHCIPVNLAVDEDYQILLAKPSFVLFDGELAEFHPYLHQLDPQLKNNCASILGKIGVEFTLSLRHIQLVLEQAKIDSNETELKDTKNCTSAAVRKLYQLLSNLSHSFEDDRSKQRTVKDVNILNPLYLPNHKGELALSTKLLYVDSDMLEGLQPQLEDTDYSLLHIEKVPSKHLLLERDLCEVLPDLVKPTPLSSVCTLAVADECELVEHTSAGKELQDMLTMSEDLSEAVASCVQFFTRNQSDPVAIKTNVSLFLSSIKIHTYKPLKMVATFKMSGKRIGTIETTFYLDVHVTKEELSSSMINQLYLDFRISKKTKVIRALSDHLLHLIRRTYTSMTNEAVKKLSDIFFEILDSKSSSEVIQTLDESCITTVSPSWRAKLGLAVPKPEEGRRWIKQAEANFISLKLLHSGLEDEKNKEACGDVCFLAHQVAEKALKGAMYFVCGLSSFKTHYLCDHAHSLERKHPSETIGLVSHASSLEEFYLDARYPNMWPLPTVPADKYEKSDADAAKHHAEAILEIVKKLIVS